MIGDGVPLDAIVGVGFGVAHVLVDGALLLDGEPRDPGASRAPAIMARIRQRPARDRRAATSWRIAGRSYLTLARVERYLEHRARSGAPVVGKIEASLAGPFSRCTWERKAPGHWVVTDEGDGFA
jgi:hypothetical protein